MTDKIYSVRFLSEIAGWTEVEDGRYIELVDAEIRADIASTDEFGYGTAYVVWELSGPYDDEAEEYETERQIGLWLDGENWVCAEEAINWKEKADGYDALRRELADINRKSIHIPMDDAAVRAIFELDSDVDVSHVDVASRALIQHSMEETLYEYGSWELVARGEASKFSHLFPDNDEGSNNA